MTGFEQLYYKWAERGLEGAARFQVVALSSGLDRPSDPRRRVISRLCYFPVVGQRADDQHSFGWIDVGTLRYAFQKTTLNEGRSGNFAAHFLVGPIEVLPASWLSASFLGDWWWSGEEDYERSLEYRPLRKPLRSSKVNSPGVGRDDIEGPLAALLSSSRIPKVTHTAASDAWRSALIALSQYDPASLDLVSFSSLEDPRSATRFTVSGAVRGTSDTPLTPDMLGAAHFLLGAGGSRASEIRSSVSTASTWRKNRPFENLLWSVTDLVTLQHPDQLTLEQLRHMLLDPHLAQIALETAAARELLVATMSHDPSALRLMRTALPSVTADIQEALATLALLSYPVSGGSLTQLLDIFAPFEAAIRGVVTAVTSVGLDTYSSLDAWPPNVCAAVLQSLDRSTLNARVLSALVRPVAGCQTPLLSLDATDPVWPAYFRHQEVHGLAALFGDQVLASRWVASAAATVASRNLIQEAVNAAGQEKGADLLCVLARIDPDRVTPLLSRIALNSDPWRWVADLHAKGLDMRLWGEALYPVVQQRAVHEALDPVAEPELSAVLANSTFSSGAVDQLAKLDRWARNRGRQPRVLSDAIEILSEIRDEYGRHEFLYCLSILVRLGRLSSSQFGALADLVRNEDEGELVARTVLAAAMRERSVQLFISCLGLLAVLGGAGNITMRRLGGVRSPQIERLLEALLDIHADNAELHEFLNASRSLRSAEGRALRRVLGSLTRL